MSTCSHRTDAGSRRRFLQTLALGGGAVLLSTLPAAGARAAGAVDALLLTCMDYRLENEILAYMDGGGVWEQ